MKIPKQFQLAGAVWEVVQKDVIISSDGNNCLGLTHRDKLIIEIRKDQPKTVKETTFLHELVHAIKFTQGINEDAHHEDDIDGFAQLLHQYLTTAK